MDRIRVAFDFWCTASRLLARPLQIQRTTIDRMMLEGRVKIKGSEVNVIAMLALGETMQQCSGSSGGFCHVRT